jgi:hypothetical protein
MRGTGVVFIVAALLQTTAIAVAGAVVLPPGSLTVPSSGTFLYLNSNGFVGDGREILIVAAPDKIVSGGLRLDHFNGLARATNEDWHVDLRAPQGVAMTARSYVDTDLYDQTAGAQISVRGNGHSCMATGQFDVTELALSSLGEISVFDASFELDCDGGTTGLVGRIRIESPAPAPGATLPPGSVTVPTSGSFLYLIQTNTFVGTHEQIFTTADSWFDPRLGAEEFRAWVTRFDYTHWWSVTFDAPMGRALSVGRYADALRPEFHNAVNPGLNSDGDGQGCNEIHGNFTVDALSRAASGEIRVFQATFHYYCDVSVVQQHGRIRIENLALPPAPAPVVGVSVKEEATVNIKTGAATITGTVSCDRSVPMTVSGQIRQITNKTNESVTFSRTVDCVAPITAWSIVVIEGVFRPGDAAVSVSASWCEETCVTASTARTLKLNSGNG